MHALRPKVVHVVVAGEIGGAERFLIELATRPDLSGADHVLALMTPNPALRAFFAGAGLRIRDRGPVHENPLAYLWRSWGPTDIAWLARAAREEGAQVLHAHTYASHVLAARAALRLGLPLVRTEHGVGHYRDPTCSLFRQWALRHTDRIVAVSGFVGRIVAEIAPHAANRVETILNGVDLARFAPVPPLQEGPFTLVAVGRLSPVKRIEMAVEAVARTPEVRLVIAGEGRERGRLERLAGERGVASRVRFLGRLEDPRPAIAGCDAMINCTREEGMPLAVLEAAAMQRPTIAFAGGGVPEIVEDRRTGWLVREDTVDAFAAVVRDATRARAAEYGAAARAVAEQRFGLETMCNRYAAVYTELSAGRVRAACTTA